MSQLILDDHVRQSQVSKPLEKWTTVQRLRDLRPDEIIKDERVQHSSSNWIVLPLSP
jgi:hypothetical protein